MVWILLGIGYMMWRRYLASEFIETIKRANIFPSLSSKGREIFFSSNFFDKYKPHGEVRYTVPDSTGYHWQTDKMQFQRNELGVDWVAIIPAECNSWCQVIFKSRTLSNLWQYCFYLPPMDTKRPFHKLYFETWEPNEEFVRKFVSQAVETQSVKGE